MAKFEQIHVVDADTTYADFTAFDTDPRDPTDVRLVIDVYHDPSDSGRTVGLTEAQCGALMALLYPQNG